MAEILTTRLRLTPFSLVDFDRFVAEMLTDARVVQHYHSYDHTAGVEALRERALADFWAHFQESRKKPGLEIWAAYDLDAANRLIGWSGLLWTSVSLEFGGPELHYMIAGDAHGAGYATELATAVIDNARSQFDITDVIGVVDIPNTGSIRVLEKLEFRKHGKITAYGSADMFLYRRSP